MRIAPRGRGTRRRSKRATSGRIVSARVMARKIKRRALKACATRRTNTKDASATPAASQSVRCEREMVRRRGEPVSPSSYGSLSMVYSPSNGEISLKTRRAPEMTRRIRCCERRSAGHPCWTPMLDTHGAACNHDTRGRSYSVAEKALTKMDGAQTRPQGRAGIWAQARRCPSMPVIDMTYQERRKRHWRYFLEKTSFARLLVLL